MLGLKERPLLDGVWFLYEEDGEESERILVRGPSDQFPGIGVGLIRDARKSAHGIFPLLIRIVQRSVC